MTQAKLRARRRRPRDQGGPAGGNPPRESLHPVGRLVEPSTPRHLRTVRLRSRGWSSPPRTSRGAWRSVHAGGRVNASVRTGAKSGRPPPRGRTGEMMTSWGARGHRPRRARWTARDVFAPASAAGGRRPDVRSSATRSGWSASAATGTASTSCGSGRRGQTDVAAYYAGLASPASGRTREVDARATSGW